MKRPMLKRPKPDDFASDLADNPRSKVTQRVASLGELLDAALRYAAAMEIYATELEKELQAADEAFDVTHRRLVERQRDDAVRTISEERRQHLNRVLADNEELRELAQVRLEELHALEAENTALRERLAAAPSSLDADPACREDAERLRALASVLRGGQSVRLSRSSTDLVNITLYDRVVTHVGDSPTLRGALDKLRAD